MTDMENLRAVEFRVVFFLYLDACGIGDNMGIGENQVV